MKLLLVLFSVALALVSGATLFSGERETDDSLACFGKIYVSPRENKTSSIKHSCRVLSGQNITYVVAEDAMDETGNGGTAEILQGGVGQKYVTLKFTSQEGQALDFTIKVYAQNVWWWLLLLLIFNKDFVLLRIVVVFFINLVYYLKW